MKKYKFILSGGGTGGHIYPAIAIANELKIRFPESDFLFVGAEDKMEMQKVPQAGYPIVGLWIAGLQRKLTFSNMLFPFKLLHSLWKSRKIIKNFKPDIVIGTGGFASGPLLQMAGNMSVPMVIQEQNSYPGITNKLLSKKANTIFVAYENLERFFPKDKIILTGNPVRQDLTNTNISKEKATNFFQLDSSKATLLVLGGSLGSRRINQLIEKEIEFFRNQNIEVIWQCGKFYYEQYKRYNSDNVKVFAFIEKMNFAYTAADIVISRSGASSVSELCIVGKPVIFIPSPNVAEDHQTKNAKSISDKNAAILLKEEELDSRFTTVFSELINDKNRQAELHNNITKLALPNATKTIADEIVKILNN